MKKIFFIVVLACFYADVFGQAPIFRLHGPYNISTTTPVDLNTNGDPMNGKFTFHFIGDTGGSDFNARTLNLQVSLDGTTYTNLQDYTFTDVDITDDIVFNVEINGYARVVSSGTCDVDVYFAEIVTDTR